MHIRTAATDWANRDAPIYNSRGSLLQSNKHSAPLNIGISYVIAEPNSDCLWISIGLL